MISERGGTSIVGFTLLLTHTFIILRITAVMMADWLPWEQLRAMSTSTATSIR